MLSPVAPPLRGKFARSAKAGAPRSLLALAFCISLACVPLTAQAQNRASGFWNTVNSYVCNYSGGDWVGTRCARSGGVADNLVPAMSNVDTRDGTDIILVEADAPAAPGFLSVRMGPRSVSFRMFPASAISAQLYRMNEPGFAATTAFAYRTNVDDPRFLGLYNPGQVPGHVLATRADTAPYHGLAIPVVPGRDCRSFPSCMRVAERHEQWYRGYKGNGHFPPQANPNWTHEPLPARCSPFAAEYVPPFLVDGLVFGELRNDLRYLTEGNIAGLRQAGYDFEALLVQDFGSDWRLNSSLMAVNPVASRKARVDPGAPGTSTAGRPGKARLRPAPKTDAYYADLIANRLIVANPQYVGAQCQPVASGQAPRS